MKRRIHIAGRVAWAVIAFFGLATTLQARPLTLDERGQIEALLSGAAGPTSEFIEVFALLSDEVTEDFLARFLALEAADAEMTLAIFNAGFDEALSERDRGKLLRGSIMIPDIYENVRYVAQTGDIREVDGRMEGTGILRFVGWVVEDFPQTRAVLDEAFFQEASAAYEAAALAIEERGARARASAAEAREISSEARASAERDAEFTRQLRIEIERMRAFTQQLQTLVDAAD